jgi:hypothetical protein
MECATRRHGKKQALTIQRLAAEAQSMKNLSLSLKRELDKLRESKTVFVESSGINLPTDLPWDWSQPPDESGE